MPTEKPPPPPSARPRGGPSGFDRPRDLTPEEIESLRQDSKESHARLTSHFKKLKAEGHPAFQQRPRKK